jgi:hypothetical protein
MKRMIAVMMLLLTLSACSLLRPGGIPQITPTATSAPVQPTATPALEATEAATVEATLPPTEDAPPTATPAPTLPIPEGGTARTEQLFVFKNALVQALAHRDWEVLRTLMDGGVNVVGSPTGLFPEDVALAALEEQLASDAELHELDLGYLEYEDGSWQGTTFEERLGFDVTICCPQDVVIAAAVLVDGWGAEGDQQAMLIIEDRGPLGWVWWGYLGPLTDMGS